MKNKCIAGFVTALLAVVLLLTAPVAFAVSWTNWNSITPGGQSAEAVPGSGSGVITFISGTVDVGLTGVVSGFYNDTSAYTPPATWDNMNPTDMIEERQPGRVTLTFSRPVVDLHIALYSVGIYRPPAQGYYYYPVSYAFQSLQNPIEVVSSGPSEGFGEGIYSIENDTFIGAEFSGILKLPGTYSSLTFDIDPVEFWHGFNIGCSAVVQTWTVTPSTVTVDSSWGTITPDSPQTVNDGGSTSFTITPQTGYQIESVGGTCGGSLTGMTYTTDAITANCTVIATFTLIDVEPAVELPRTGQEKCYASQAPWTEVACTETRQDGDIRAGISWPNPRFTTGTGSETNCMIDNLTGLMWPKNANLPGGTRAFDLAIDYTNNLTLCGHSDWRLPSLNELESLIHADTATTKAWLDTQGFTKVQTNTPYWSSTTVSGDTDNAWIVSMKYGDVDYDSKSDKFSVWPVRTGNTTAPAQVWRTGQTESLIAGDDGDLRSGVAWPEQRFTVSGSCVMDNVTGLMWAENAGLAASISWEGALNYFDGFSLCGYSDWRLPNRKELMSLVDRSQHNPSLPQDHPFTSVEPLGYWSSTTCATQINDDDIMPYNSDAWVVVLEYGRLDYVAKSGRDGYYGVWPVRAGQVGESGTVNGQCGSANGGSFASAPTSNLCATGTPSVVAGLGPWTWACDGTNGGSNADCSADLVISCDYIVSSPKPATYKGGTVLFNVTASDKSCTAPEVEETSDWITTSPFTWSKGKGTVKLTVSANTAASERSVVIAIGEAPVTVTQQGAPCKMDAFAPKSGALPVSGGAGSFSFLLPDGCGWTASPDTKSAWIVVGTPSGDGPGEIGYSAAPNTTGKALSGKINVTLTSTGKTAKYSVKQGK